MAITVISTPAFPVSFAKNPVLFKFQTNNRILAPGAKAAVTIVFANSAPVGQGLIFKWNGIELIFVAATNPDNSGLQYQAGRPGNIPMVDTVDLILEDLSGNATLLASFSLTKIMVGSDAAIRVEAREYGSQYNLTIQSSLYSASQVVAGSVKSVRTNFKIRADLYIADASGLSLITSEEQYPDSTETCNFDFSSKLDTYCLSGPLPAVNISGAEQCPAIIQKFLVRYAESYGEPSVAQASTSTAFYFALGGGVAKQKFPNNNIISTIYTGSPKPFLTNQPIVKLISKLQLTCEYLYVLIPSNTSLAATAIVTYNDASTSTWTGSAFGGVANKIFKVSLYDVLLHILANETPTKKALKFKFKVTTSGGAVFSEERTYNFDYRYFQSEKYLVFRNSLGGFDTIRIYGEVTHTLDPKSESAESTLPFNYSHSNAQLIKFNVSYQDSLKVSTGFVSLATIQYLKELYISDEVFIIQGSQLIPVIIKAKAGDLYKEYEGLYSDSFEIQFAYLNNCY